MRYPDYDRLLTFENKERMSQNWKEELILLNIEYNECWDNKIEGNETKIVLH